MKLPGVAPSAISIRGLTKSYGALIAVNDLHLEVAAAEILGFLGLNGAGKTTTIRILLDLLRPTHGAASICGHDCQAASLSARALCGYLPGEVGMYADLTGLELLNFLGGLTGQSFNPRYRQELQERLQLPDKDLRRKLREYSAGMKRKLGLIQAFQTDPALLILDEPTEGLDPLMQESFYVLLADVQKRGKTIFMSSHVLSEVERVCQRIALLRKGRLVMNSTVEEIRKMAPRRVRVFFRQDVPAPATLPAGHEIIEREPRRWTLHVPGPMSDLLNLLAPLPVQDLEIKEAQLEDVLIKYYQQDST